MAVSVAAIAVTASLPVTSLKELAQYAKANPGKLSYGSAGAGTMANLAGELFKELAGTPDIVHVPYKGAAPGLSDLIAGHIPVMAANVSDAAIELHRAGKIRLLAAASERRVTAAPEIPTGAEAGYPDFIAQLFMGLFTPARTPQPVVDRLAVITEQVMADKEFQAKLVAQAFEPVAGSNPDRRPQIHGRRSRALDAGAQARGHDDELTVACPACRMAAEFSAQAGKPGRFRWDSSGSRIACSLAG